MSGTRNIFCQNTNCKHYFEDSCLKNLSGETIDISVDGRCKSFENGKNIAYEMPEIDDVAMKIIDRLNEIPFEYRVKPDDCVLLDDRKYIAISIKHSWNGRLTLWGIERTKDEEERCFAGYQGMTDYDRCELYSLDDFWNRYGNGVIKCDKPVPMTSNLVNEWADYDTVLVDYGEYKKFVTRGLGRAERCKD